MGKATDDISILGSEVLYIAVKPISSINDAKAGLLLNEGGTVDIDFYLDGSRSNKDEQRKPETPYYYAVIVADEAGNAMYTLFRQMLQLQKI